jgi:hypothetical protein
MFDEIRAKTSALNEQIAALRKEAANLVKPMLQEFVASNPQVKAVVWRQYTPYFNDGEPCEFSVHDPEFFFEGEDPEEDNGHDAWSLGNEKYRPSIEICSQETAAACSELAKEIGRLDDALEELFGDHVKVVVTADGVSVDEYDHD